MQVDGHVIPSSDFLNVADAPRDIWAKESAACAARA